MTAPTPGVLAQQAHASKVRASDGPVGDADLDDVVRQVRDSVEAFVSASPADGGAVDAGGRGMPQDAGDVVARAHEAHEALTSRLRQAQA